MENFRVMQLGRWQSVDKPHIEMESIEFLKRFVPWNNLRYLSLQEISRITELPETIGKLTSLLILNLRACHNLERLPPGIGYLKELTHLDVSGCYLLDHLPRGIRSLLQLQVLKGFVMGNSRSKDPCKLSDLVRLKKLRKLSITIGQESVHVPGEVYKLQEFKALTSLTITWGIAEPTKPKEPTLTEPTEPTKPNLTIPALTFPQQLEKLDIRAFPLKTVPEWLSGPKLPGLKRLYIRGGKLVSLERIGSQTVQVLRLRFLKELSVEWKRLQDMFSSLGYLEVKECPILLKEKFKGALDSDGVWRKEY
ncbi:hypothetical protein J5N97_000620 [Dioscorea zingiberensis]|uniref:Disease resistance R13L4/SHOC-2-like LRR domain-containing protein n=1 Tax=Dioscorea zingiberensis TaxID=325984 RepID=A0A9D5H1I8_9LILI|nr:hypothetical protein J5N97_000620 [Dioscorea zingiberensis]